MERRRMMTLPAELLNRPGMRGIHSVIAPFIYIRDRLSEVEEAHLDEAQCQRCGTFRALRSGRPPCMPFRNISAFTSMSYEFSQELFRTAQAMMFFTNSTDMELYFIDAWKNEIYRCPRTPGENKNIVHIKIGPGTTLAAYVAYTKTYVLADELINNEDYPLGLDKNDSIAQRVICIPVTTPSNEVIAIIELARDAEMEPYSTEELEACMNTCSWIGSTVESSHTKLGLTKKVVLYDYFQSLLNTYLFESVPLRQYISELLAVHSLTPFSNSHSTGKYFFSRQGEALPRKGLGYTALAGESVFNRSATQGSDNPCCLSEMYPTT